MQNGFKKCIFYGTPSPGLAKASLVYLGRENKPIFCLCFGLGPAPLTFTKIMKILISLLRRLNIRIVIFLDDVLLLGRNSRGGFKCFEPIDFSIAKPRICDQSKEITASVCTRNRVSGAFGQSKYNDFSSATRQIDRNKLSMSKISNNPSAYNFRVDSTVRKTFVFCASSFIWTFVKEVPSGFPNKIFEKCNLWKKNLFRFFVFGRTKMVESKFASIKWKIYSKN